MCRPSKLSTRWITVCLAVGLALLSAGSRNHVARAAEPERSFPTTRPAWTGSRITGSLQPPAPYRTTRAFPHLTFRNPVVFTKAPATDRMFMVELKGTITSFPPRDDVTAADPFADLKRDVEGFQRAYGLTFHPDYPRNPTCFICYVLKPDDPNGTRVSRFRVATDDPPRLLPETEEIC